MKLLTNKVISCLKKNYIYKMRKIFIIWLTFTSLTNNAQEYLDVFSVSYSKTPTTSYKNSFDKSSISIFDAKVTLPLVINKKTAIITGFDFSLKELNLSNNSDETKLFYNRIKLGITTEHSDYWTGTYILLPVIASDYKKLSNQDIYIGAISFWTYKKKKNLNYKFGVYAGNEAYGLYITPILGIYYITPNSNFEISALLPGLLDMNLKISNKIKLGFDYKGVSETFKIHEENKKIVYTENRTLEFSSYVQNNSFIKNLLLRLKFGFSTNKYDIYTEGDKIDLSITPIKIGDNRIKLNKNLNSSAFLKLEAIYRFDIPSK